MSSTETTAGPERILRTLTAYQEAAALATAIELDLFTAVGTGSDRPLQLGLHLGIAERGARMLADRMVVAGYLDKRDGRWALTSESARFLDRRSSECIAPVASFLHSRELRGAFDALPDSVRRGGTSWGSEGTLEPEHGAWVSFARGMGPLARRHARELAALVAPLAPPRGSILDVAAGHGWYGIELARALPQAALVALDWRPVLAVVSENARVAGVEARASTLEGDARSLDLAGPHGTLLVVNWLHHFDLGTAGAFLARARRALLPGGLCVVVEFVVEEDRVRPPESAGFGLVMLATTPAGDCFTESELVDLARDAGFVEPRLERLPGMVQRVLLARA